MFANLYRACRDAGMPNPREVDELEIWESAVLTGADGWKPPKEDNHAHLRADLEYRRQRAAFEAGEGPAPDASLKFEWGESTEEEQELMAVLASGSSFAP